MAEFTVIRNHLGDRHYRPGDLREADEMAVAHLVRAGVLVKIGKPPANKALRVPENKSGPSSASTGKATPASSSHRGRAQRKPKSKPPAGDAAS